MHRHSLAVFRGFSAAPASGLGSRRHLPSHAPRRLAAPLSFAVAWAILPLVAAGCVPAAVAGSLPATLSLQPAGSSTVAFQNGIPVPTFDPQPRATLDLSGAWQVERTALDTDLTLTDRRESLAEIEVQAGGRQLAAYDDATWTQVAVPGSVNPPPSHASSSAWYRRHFAVPDTWAGHALTLKFGAANYVADVWLNGHYLGYHEGGFTPFAFDVSGAIEPGKENVLAVRVDAPEWGSRDDIVPWGLADWWNYGGLTQPVWLEASSSVLIDRADVVPHLDGADVSITLEQRAVRRLPAKAAVADIVVEIFPATIDEPGLAAQASTPEQADAVSLDAWSLIPPDATPLGRTELASVQVPASGAVVARTGFSIAHATAWSIAHPALYVLRVTLLTTTGEIDQIYQSFGLRHIAVDTASPRLLLNGAPVAFSGVSVHAEAITDRSAPGVLPGGPAAEPLSTLGQAYAQLSRARKVNATLVRTAHQPGVPILLSLADRLGIAVWEEIPLYHFTPRTFDVTLQRGIPQQMLREMALRDMNRPSVLFYGLANESTGDGERASAMATLKDVAHGIDGTRLTGQASYGFDPSDGTSDPLDVAGYTFYYGVFYGKDPAEDTRQALAAAHARYPSKPLMVLEFGRWADGATGQAEQSSILASTQGAIADRYDVEKGGYVGASVWWSLEDYYTMRPGIEVERFGLFDPSGRPRLAGQNAPSLFDALPRTGVDPALPTDAAVAVARPLSSSGGTLRLAMYLGYGFVVVAGTLGAALAVALVFNGRATRRVS